MDVLERVGTPQQNVQRLKPLLAGEILREALHFRRRQPALSGLHIVKSLVPERVCQILDQAIQMHGALGASQHTPLARIFAMQHTLRLADELNSAIVWRN